MREWLTRLMPDGTEEELTGAELNFREFIMALHELHKRLKKKGHLPPTAS